MKVEVSLGAGGNANIGLQHRSCTSFLNTSACALEERTETERMGNVNENSTA